MVCVVLSLMDSVMPSAISFQYYLVCGAQVNPHGLNHDGRKKGVLGSPDAEMVPPWSGGRDVWRLMLGLRVGVWCATSL